MRPIRSLAALLAAGVLAAAHARGQAAPASTPLPADAAPPPVPVERRGPRVGERIPALHLPDQTGRERDLPSLAGTKGLVLLFVRSADW